MSSVSSVSSVVDSPSITPLFFVGSTNPVKLGAVTDATVAAWPLAKVTGLEVPSGVSEQPLTDEETRTGAHNRARAALKVGLKHQPPTADDVVLGIGLEGGVTQLDHQLWSTVWVAVVDAAQPDKVWESCGARFVVPEPFATQIREGGEMGPVVAQLTNQEDIRSKQGIIGVLTQGFVERREEYAAIAKLAIGTWYGRGWRDQLQ